MRILRFRGFVSKAGRFDRPPLHFLRWLVFDSEGALIATVSTPEGFEPYAVREGLVWGVYTDELDIESVCAYEVLKRPENS